ncbi:hypothetical protein Z517_09585 [Fonsecaea pedrosoi CBS 271.37]|uniref:Aminoglycoside phosphotransferase domain-containing protein n=1 Tax=Fonsecaea pedrosoi CBS 271.37 TaxID=1442368 RepID=A0A0D2GXP4_9EURO|nr:uncharacterized protein Z517_09585 [Fonsecaea pedrosoi CBS 271.37]KIW77139.1 hypothetical protein Z517_09585 [Fonsecaea pedrosoi CBS 271.37]
MDINEPIELLHDVQKELWAERVNRARVTGIVTSWISSLHPKKLECSLDGNFLNGSYNLCQKLRFRDGTIWLLRMPIVGSVCDEQAVAPQLVEPSYAFGPYKLICDDLGLANLIVRSAEDLTVVGLVDLEYRLNNYDTFLDEEEIPKILQRYLRNLDMFKTVLEEEEARIPGQPGMEVSRLVRHSEESGSMWLHRLLSWGFNHPDSLPFAQLRARLGPERWKELEEGHHGNEAKQFTERKLAELDKYDEMVEKIECLREDVENGKITREAFVALLTNEGVQRRLKKPSRLTD